jgi:WD40 repeat protein
MIRKFACAGIAVVVLMGCAQPEDLTVTAEPIPVEPTQAEATGEATGEATIQGVPTDDPGEALPTPMGEALKSDRLPPTAYHGALPEGAIGALGMGALSVSVSPDGQVFAVRSPLGVMAYDFNTLVPLWDGEKPNGEITWLTEGRVQIGRFTWRVADGAMLWEASEARQISPDGTLVVGSDGVNVTLYDRESGEARFILTPPPEEMFTEVSAYYEWHAYVSFSPDSRFAAVYYIGGAIHEQGSIPVVKVWDLQTGALLHDLPDYSFAYFYWDTETWSPDSSKLITAHSDTMTIWDVESGEPVVKLPVSIHIFWSLDGSRLLVGNTEDNILHVWDAIALKELYSIPWMSGSYPAGWSPDGAQFMMTDYAARQIILYDATLGEPIDQIDNAACYKCTISADQNHLLGWILLQNRLAVWDLRQPSDASPVFSLRGSNRIADLDWSPDGTRIASGESGTDPQIIVWDVTSAEVQQLIPFAPDGSETLNTLDWSPDNQTIAFSTTVEDGFWNLNDQTFQPQAMGFEVAISPDSNTLATTSSDGEQFEIIFRDASTDAVSAQTPITDKWVMGIDWSPDSRFVAAALLPERPSWPLDASSEVILINAATGEITGRLGGIVGWIGSVAWSPDGTQIAAGFNQDKVAIWDVQTGTVLTELSGGIPRNENDYYVDSLSYLSLDWSPEGSLLAGAYGNTGMDGDCPGCGGASSGAVVVWRVDAGYSVAHRWIDDFYESAVVAFSPDGSVLASGSRSGVIMLWDVGE